MGETRTWRRFAQACHKFDPVLILWRTALEFPLASIYQ